VDNTVTAAVFAIGSELLEGSITDTNSAWIGSRLVKHGINVEDVRLLPDNMDRMAELFLEAAEKYDLIITTGGLGPTFDDLTAEVVSRVAGKNYILNEEQLEHIKKRLAKFGISLKENHFHQAKLPEGCRTFFNRMGTAFGFSVQCGGARIISMPGIPYEMKPMFDEQVLPWLHELFPLRERHIRDLRIAGKPESEVDDVIRELGIPDGIDCIINVGKGDILVKVRGFDEEAVQNFAEAVRKPFENNFIGYGDETFPARLVRMLKEKGLTAGFAESCTGGMLGAEITSVAGSSAVFKGSVVSYSNDVKINLLGVPADVIEAHGAVSAECALAMAEGAKKLLGTDCAAAVTGIAGPDGGTDEKPVGTVFIAVSVNGKTEVKGYGFSGDRPAIRERSVKTAFAWLIDLLK
jgi:nicotinamide-nucleotide amidase